MNSTAVAAWAWWSVLWVARDGFSSRPNAASPHLRLNSICRLQSDLWALNQAHTSAFLLRLPGRSLRPPLTAEAPYAPPVVLWPPLLHELLGIELSSVAKQNPKARRRTLSEAWGARSGAILQKRQTPGSTTWALPALLGRKPQSLNIDQSTLEGQLFTLGSLAGNALSDERTWKMYVEKMVNKRSWRGGWFGLDEPEDEDSRAARLREVCKDAKGFAPPP